MLRRTLRTFCLLLPLCCCLSTIVVATESGDSEEPDTPLQSRAKELLKAYAQVRTAEDRADLREKLSAMADTLAAADEPVLQAYCLDRAGILWYHTGDTENARKNWEEGLAVARTTDDLKLMGTLLNSVGIGLQIASDYEGAIDLAIELIEVRRKADDLRGEAISWANLANCYTQLRRMPEALAALERSSALSREVGYHRGNVFSLLQSCSMVHLAGRPEDGIAFADSALALSRRENLAGFEANARSTRARMLTYAGRPEEALPDYEAAIELATSQGELRTVRTATVNYADALCQARRFDEALERIDEMLPPILANGVPHEVIPARILRVTALKGLGRLEEAETYSRETVDLLESYTTELSDEASKAGVGHLGGFVYFDLASISIGRGKPEDGWRIAEHGTAMLLRQRMEGGNGDPVTLASLQRVLRETNAALVQFFQSGIHSIGVFVVDASGVHGTELEWTYEAMQDLKNVTARLSSGASDQECHAILARLSGLMLSPVMARVGDDIERMVIVSGGGIVTIPMEALPLPDQSGETLGDRYAISHVPSATALTRLHERRPSAQGMVAFADPRGKVPDGAGEQATVVTTRSSRLARTPLPEARREVEQIAPSWAQVHIGPDAEKERFYSQDVQSASVLHFATHALIDPLQEDYGALILAGEEEEEALLTAVDIEKQPIQADLVTLSGCATGGGFKIGGEGTLGLARSFFLAGARSVVMSLWDVQDAAARRFMELFYQGLEAGNQRDVAVQQARQRMKEEGYPHRDRSAFVLAGVGAEPVQALLGGDESLVREYAPILLGAVIAALVTLLAARIFRRSSADPA